MATPPTVSATGSLWLEDPGPWTPRSARIDGETVDVAVIGGGITGATTALLLAREGVRVALIEANTVGTGVTGTTTAKVSALQATVLSTIRSRHGQEAATVYAQASLAAVGQVALLTEQESIDCDLVRSPAVTYALDDSEVKAVEQEAETARAAGLAVEAATDAGLPFPVPAAVRLNEQIGFHPVKYVRGLVAALERAGGLVREGVRVTRVSARSPFTVHTSDGRLTAEWVIDATHYPLLDRGVYFARLEAMRSYCIGVELAGGELPQSMAISAGSNSRSIRAHGDTLIIGGEGHPSGATDATPERYARLEAFAREHWDVRAITHRWSAQDPVPYDHLPVVGPYLPGSDRLLVASGFLKWGLTGGTAAAIVLRDRILGRENPWATTFAPTRFSARGLPKLTQLGLKFSAEIVGDRLKPAQADDAAEIPPGEARTVRDGRGKTGVYRDHGGALHAVSLRCTHLGCLLRFNAAEHSWDCPCHGSRFDVDGNVLEGPASRPLERKAPPA
jgi:glycine/D-amino acid oxidase-like deaminating enzyme/nitrite reductase/ring-hydroxylating ferredoxin subunit